MARYQPRAARANANGARMTLTRMHEDLLLDAHHLPAGKTAASGKRERGRPAGQAAKLFEDRQLLLSKASAPFVKTGEF